MESLVTFASTVAVASRGPASIRVIVSVLGVATMIQVIGAILTQSLALLGPQLITTYHLTPAQFGVLLSSVNVGMLLAFLVGGLGADRLGARALLVLSALASGAFVAAAGLARSAPVIELVLVAAGFAWGVSVPAGGGAVVRIAPAGRRGLFVSNRQLGLPVGGTAAAAAVPLFVAWNHWNWIFLVEGAMFLAAGMVALHSSLPTVGASGRALRRFPAQETLLLGVGGALVGAGQWIFIGYLTYDLTFRVGLSFGMAASVFLGVQLAGAAGRLCMGWLSDQIGGRLLWLITTSAASAACLLAFGSVSGSTPLIAVVALSLITGFVAMGWNGVLIAAFAEVGPRGLAGTSIGSGPLLNRVGVLVAPPAFGLLLAYVAPSFACAATAVVLVVAAGIFTLLRAEMRPVHPSWSVEA